MRYDFDECYVDFSENGQIWHWDSKFVPESGLWVNICHGKMFVVEHFCHMIDVLLKDFKMKLTTDQIIRLAECTPGLTVYNRTPVPEDSFDAEVHNVPIWSREKIERLVSLKPFED